MSLVGPLLVLLAAVTPYVGLNTERAFSMFSNLQTEGDRWNHLFLPQRMRVFGFQDHLYELVSSSDPDLQRVATDRAALVEFEMRRRLSANPEASVTYRIVGEQRELLRAGDDERISRPLNPLLGWLFWFRPVSAHGGCAH